MKAKRFIIAIALATLFCLHAARAQTPQGEQRPQSPDAASKVEARRALESKAVELLGETVSAARGLKLAENRARVLATAAGLLWPRDEKAARSLFKEATDIVLTLMPGPEARQPDDASQSAHQLRQEMLELVAGRDAKLALDFLRATRRPSAEREQVAGGHHRVNDPELALEMNLAVRIAAQDPKQALAMAEESLGRGVSSGLVNVLHMLRQKDPEAATHLAGLIIKRLTSADLLNDYEATNVATQLLSFTRPASPPAPAHTNQAPQVESLQLAGVTVDERLRRLLIEIILGAAVSNRPTRTGHGLIQALQQVLPEVEKYAPSRLAALRARTADFERNLDPQSRVLKDYRSVIEQGTIESLVEAASKAPAGVRDHLYMQAFWRAMGDGQGDRARQIAESISNPQQRAQMLREFERQLPWRAVGRGDYEEARALVARLPSAEERITLLMQIAGSLLAKNDKQGARQLLEEASAMVGARAQNQQQFNSQIEVALQYAALDEARAFEIVEAAVGQLNELIGAAAVLDGFYQDAFKEGELRQQGGYMWNDLIGRCATGLAQLAPADFSRARSVAEGFQRPDARVMAQLLLAQNVLNNIAQENEQTQPNLPAGRRTRNNVRSVRVLQH